MGREQTSFTPNSSSIYQGKLLMAFTSVLNKPIVLESFEHEIMLHAQGLAESGIYRRTRHDTVIIYKGKPKCMYDVTDHGGAIALNRIYTIDDEPLISSALKMAESRGLPIRLATLAMIAFAWLLV